MRNASSKVLEYLPRSQRHRLLLHLLRSPSRPQLFRTLPKVHPADIAQVLPLLPPDTQVRVTEILFELRLAGRTIRELEPESQRQLLGLMPKETLAVILGRLSADDAADILGQFEEDRRRELLDLLPDTQAARLENLMLYGDSTAGGLMDPDVLHFPADLTVGETLESLRRLAERRRLFYLYVTDERRHLIGLVNLWQLVSSPHDRRLRDIMGSDVVTARVDMPQAEVARLFSRYDLLMLPVVDEDGRLTGVVTVDDVLDVMEEEASEDLYRLANLAVPESLGTAVHRSISHRLPRLLLALAAASLIGLLVLRFVDTVARLPLLAVFLPVVLVVSVNAGTQTLTVMINALARGEMDLRGAARVVPRQVAVGLACGLATGLLGAGIAWLWGRNWALAGVVLATQTVGLMAAGLFGCAVPLLLWRLKRDPAAGSSILVDTSTALTTLAAYLGAADRWLR